MSRSWSRSVALVLALVALPTSVALARGGYRDLVEQLGLSADQEARVTEAVQAHQLAEVDLRAKVKKARLELKQMMLAESVDEKAAYKKLAEADAAMAEMHREKLGMMLELKKTLTPEQWEKAVELREDARAERREGWGE